MAKAEWLNGYINDCNIDEHQAVWETVSSRKGPGYMDICERLEVFKGCTYKNYYKNKVMLNIALIYVPNN